jgi:hypothetical protein
MQKDIVAQWDKNKGNLETYFRITPQPEYADSYLAILKIIVGLVLTDKQYKLSRITVVDDGDWQGTQLFLIPEDVYQPSLGHYLLTHTYYGSCSGCDTLKKINQYEEGLPSEDQIAAYMTLSLHLIQKMTRITTPENRLLYDLYSAWLN